MLRHPFLPGLRTLLAAVLISACHTPAALVDVAPTLTPAEPQQREIRSGEVHTYLLSLSADRFVRLYATQKEVDLALMLLAPDGETVATADGAMASLGNEVLVALTKPAGEYRVRVVARQAPETGGVYEISLAEDREIQTGDDRRLLGLRSYIQAYQLAGPDATPATQRLIVHHLEEAARRFREIDDPLFGWALLRIAQARLALDEPGKAEKASRGAIANMDRHGQEPEKVAAYNSLGDALAAQDDPPQALRAYGEAIRLAEAHNAINELAINLNDRGILHRQLGDLEAAKADLEKAIHYLDRFSRENPHVEISNHEVTATVNLGVVYRKLGKTERAFALYEEAADLARRTDWTADELHLFTNLGRAYIAVGRLEEAHETLTQALELARRLQKPSEEQAILSNFGMLYRILGQPETALESYRDSLQLASRLNATEEMAQSWIGLGQTHREVGDLQQALDSFRQARGASESSASLLVKAEAVREIGTTLAELGAPEEGLSKLQESLILTVNAPPPMVANHLIALAGVREQLGDLQEAHKTLRRAADLNLSLEDPIGHSFLHARLARLESRMGDFGAAERNFGTALTTYEQLRARLVSPDQRASFLARWRDLYRELIDLLIERHQRNPDAEKGGETPLAQALAVSERSRARVLVELLAEARIKVRGDSDPHMLEQEQALRTRISLLQSALLDDDSVADPDQRIRDRRAMEEAVAQLRTLEQRIRREHRKYAELQYPQPLDAAAIQSLLPPQTALLEYMLGPERSHLFLVLQDSISHFVLPPADTIRAEVRAFRQTIQELDPRARTGLASATTRLSRWLLTPVAEELAETEHLWIVPDGALYYLPFELLQTDDGSFLLDKWTNRYVPSATTLTTLTEETGKDHDVDFVAFAAPTDGLIDSDIAKAAGQRPRSLVDETPTFPPLPASEREVRGIAALFPGRSELFVGSEANKLNITQELKVKTVRWLHFASHSWIDERDPARSAIILAPDPNGDALLSVSDIFNLNLNCEAVVLSACETGLGEEVDGEGLVGFTRAFFYAGCSNVVVSLWPVADEATAALMQRLYVGLADGKAVAEALRDAKRSMIAESTWRHPRYWAPFIVVGGHPASTRNVAPVETTY